MRATRERLTRRAGEAAREVRVRLRMRAPEERRLPDFMVIGAQRCGTTSLFNYLSAHPDVTPSLGKEVHFFTRHWGCGIRWYRAHFPPCASPTTTFEATPYYLFHPHAPWRAAQVLPHARMIVLLRDPIARAVSHYRHNLALGNEHMSFADAIAAEHDRTAAEFQRMLDDPGYESTAVQRYSYVGRGRYAEQLERWFSAFPPERFLLLRTEELEHDAARVVARALEFLGLRPWATIPFERLSHRSRSAPAGVSDDTIRRLEAAFRADGERLAAMLGPEYSYSWS